MFIITQIEDQIRVQPADLTKAPLDAVTQVIEQRFVDKVIPNLGLVVSIYDVTNIEGGFVYPNDGAAFFTVQFRLVVFRPFIGEIIVGKLKSCSRCAPGAGMRLRGKTWRGVGRELRWVWGGAGGKGVSIQHSSSTAVLRARCVCPS